MAEPRGSLLELPAESAEDGAGTPSGVVSPEGHDPGLHLGRDLVGAAIRLGAVIGERAEATGSVAKQPAVHGPAVDSQVPGGTSSDCDPVTPGPDAGPGDDISHSLDDQLPATYICVIVVDP
jgi:hypothetical protein